MLRSVSLVVTGLPRSSWQTSGSGVYMGLLWCRTYCVLWNVQKASPLRKSLGWSSPATGRICHPVVSLQYPAVHHCTRPSCLQNVLYLGFNPKTLAKCSCTSLHQALYAKYAARGKGRICTARTLEREVLCD